MQVAGRGCTTKPKFKIPLYWFIFHVLSHYAFPLELTHTLVNRSIGELLVAAYPENVFLDDQKEASVSIHDHTPRFLLVVIKMVMFIRKMNILQYF